MRKNDLSYTIRYFKDNTSTKSLGQTVVNNVTFGAEITVADGSAEGQLNWKQPDGYSSGVQQGTVPYVIDKESGNVIDVVYTKNSYPYTVEYYKDSVDPANKIGEAVDGPAHEYASELTEEIVSQDLGADWQNQKQQEGYGDGTTNDLPQQIKVEGNVIRVVYTKNSYPYTVEYYKDLSLIHI